MGGADWQGNGMPKAQNGRDEWGGREKTGPHTPRVPMGIEDNQQAGRRQQTAIADANAIVV